MLGGGSQRDRGAKGEKKKEKLICSYWAGEFNKEEGLWSLGPLIINRNGSASQEVSASLLKSDEVSKLEIMTKVYSYLIDTWR